MDVLHAKFETLASRVHGTDADGGEPKSQAYYIVKVGAVLQRVAACQGIVTASPTCVTLCHFRASSLVTNLDNLEACA